VWLLKMSTKPSGSGNCVCILIAPQSSRENVLNWRSVRDLKSLPKPMSPYKRPSRYDARATLDLAQRRVAAVLACLKVLCPVADLRTRQQLASKILALAHGEEHPTPRKVITEAAVYEMLTRNSQCVLNQTGRCPLLVFSQQFCEELNSFFQED
jgi:hypothetical protein